MENVSNAISVAEGISNYGLIVVVASFYLVITAAMVVAIFKWFKNIINKIIEQNSLSMAEVLEETRKQNTLLNDIADGLRTETQMRIRNVSGFAFDLSIEQVCKIIKRVKEENNISNKEKTAKKVRLLLRNLHEDRNSRFDTFVYRGKRLSKYCQDEWVEQVAIVVESELYGEIDNDEKRMYTNVKAVYDNIKLDFYHKMNV